MSTQVKKRLSKIIEDERGDEDGALTRAEGQNEGAGEEDGENDSLLNLDDEDSSSEEEVN